MNLDSGERTPYPPIRPRKDVAWHYTDLAGLLGILQSRKMWASAPLALNDTSEVDYGVQLLKRAWKQRQKAGNVPPIHSLMHHFFNGGGLAKELQSQVFVASASKKSDLLSQWRNYATGGGFAIGLDVSVAWGALPLVQTDPRFGRSLLQTSVFSGWSDVIYKREEQIQAAAWTLDRLIAPLIDGSLEPEDVSRLFQINSMHMSKFVLEVKHPAFRDEREVRFIGGMNGTENLRHRISSGRLVPYIPVGVYGADLSGVPFDASSSFPIKEIWFGPRAQRGMRELLGELLKTQGFDDVVIEESKIPFLG